MRHILCVLILLRVGLLPSALSAQSPRLIPFQARLTDASGKAVPDGPRLVRFEIFGEPDGGNSFWAGEVHRTTVNGGLINVVLGTRNPLPLDRPDVPSRSFFDGSLYLQLTLDSDTNGIIDVKDPPFLPRQSVSPVAFANEAHDSRKLAGFDWAVLFGTNDPTRPLPGGRLADQSVTPEKLSFLLPQVQTGSVGAFKSDTWVSNLDQRVIDQFVEFSPPFASVPKVTAAFGVIQNVNAGVFVDVYDVTPQGARIRIGQWGTQYIDYLRVVWTAVGLAPVSVSSAGRSLP